MVIALRDAGLGAAEVRLLVSTFMEMPESDVQADIDRVGTGMWPMDRRYVDEALRQSLGFASS